MKNNRLTNQEIFELRSAAEEIKRLCKMETARFSYDAEKDAEIKKSIKSWLGWFESEAEKIQKIISE